jgi:3'(2'), 5'-bisphosphate nucleotidase
VTTGSGSIGSPSTAVTDTGEADSADAAPGEPPGHGQESDHELAAALADAAGRLLLDLRRGPLTGRDLGDEGDRQANAYILAGLRRARPDDAVLSEESVDDPARLRAHRVWIVDPLDGTREYTEEWRTDWAVHVALWQEGALVAGAVALPAQGVVLRDDRPPAQREPDARPLRLLVSRTRPPAVATTVAERLAANMVPMGSAGAKVAAVILGEADAYVHAGGQYEWDSAAPVAVARAAGLFVSRLDGSPLAYNQPNPYLPDLVVCRPELADTILSAAVTAA